MSWQSYVDDHLMIDLPHGGKMESAAIVGKDGGVWASSEHFLAATVEQLELLATALGDEDAPETVAASGTIQSSGIRLGDRKFLLVRRDGDAKTLLGKQGEGGITIKASGSALVIGVFGEKDHAVPSTAVVVKMAEYLEEQGY